MTTMDNARREGGPSEPTDLQQLLEVMIISGIIKRNNLKESGSIVGASSFYNQCNERGALAVQKNCSYYVF